MQVKEIGNLSEVKHLTKENIIKNGSIFTPKQIVKISKEQLKNILNEDYTVLDMCSGYGAFLNEFKEYNCIATEYDEISYEILKQNFPNVDIYQENSLINVERSKYGLKDNDKLVIVGNPPYNDTTSMYKKNNKGSFVCDPDIQSRDMGISFLKCYNKLSPDYISVLHPLSYLIKKTNFNKLGDFTKNYQLIDATIFSSKEFESINKTNSEFPVVCALYKKGLSMDFDHIKSFKFKIIGSEKEFVLNDFETIDGKIEKYPKKGLATDIQFYTIRDINALKRNKGFVDGPISNGINVTIQNLYQYAWILFQKENFQSDNMFLYGNLSPLYSSKIENLEYKRMLASYALNNKVVQKYFSKEEVESFYGKLTKNTDKLYTLLESFTKMWITHYLRGRGFY